MTNSAAYESDNRIETAISENLKGDIQKETLDFIAFAQEHGFSFDPFDAGREVRWHPVYQGEIIGCVYVGEVFVLWLGLDWSIDEVNPADEDLKAFTWANVVNCPQSVCKPPYCQGENHSQNRWQIFDREFSSTCHAPLAFIAPDAAALDYIKKLLSMTV